jgi:X-Pro dipeptidyl-peptidase
MSPVHVLRRAVLVVAACIAAAAGPGIASAAPPSIVVEDGVTQPVFSYADAIRETVWVEARTDSNGDGRNDRIAIDVMRPAETEEGMEVASVMESSPYYGRSFPGGGEVPPDGPRGFLRWYDEFFVPRGYAVVEVEMVGTSRSEGCPTIGGVEETRSIEAAVDWLNGRAPAWYGDGSTAVASWSTGDVGMLGVSYNGTLPNAVATQGTEGLKTIVPIAAISSWYDYARDHGIAFSSWANRYPEFLANYVSVGRTIPGAAEECEDDIVRLGDLADDATDDFTDFWAERNYVPDANKIQTEKTAVFMVHGLEDWNVKRAHFSRLWYEVAKRNMPRKIWLHRGGHSDPISLRRTEWERAMHRWMDHWLYGIQNGIMSEPMADIQRPDGTWTTDTTWPSAGTQDVTLRLGPATADVAGTLSFDQSSQGTQTFTDHLTQSESAMMSNAELTKPNRLAFVTPPLGQPVRLSGTPEVQVRFASSTASTPLTALLVDYGEAAQTIVSDQTPLELLALPCNAQNVANATGCAEPPETLTVITPQRVVSRGAIDGKNNVDLRIASPLVPDRAYNIEWDLQPHDYVFPAGHRIGLVLVANNRSYIRRDTLAGQVTVYLGNSELVLPVVGGREALGF